MNSNDFGIYWPFPGSGVCPNDVSGMTARIPHTRYFRMETKYRAIPCFFHIPFQKWRHYALKLVDRPISCLLILMFVLMQAAQASAFVPSGAYILESMTRRMGSCNSLTVTQKVAGLFEQTGPATETLRFLPPGHIRIDRTTPNFHQIIQLQSDTKKTITNDVSEETAWSFSDRYLDVLIYRDINLLERRLKKYPIDISVSSLGRFEGKPVWVVGAVYPDETHPQLWVDKELLLPFRILYFESNTMSSDARIDIRFADWKMVQAMWYPSNIMIYRNKTLMVTIDVETVDPNAMISADTFENLAGHTESPPPSESEGYIRSSDMKDVEKAINSLKKQLNTEN